MPSLSLSALKVNWRPIRVSPFPPAQNLPSPQQQRMQVVVCSARLLSVFAGQLKRAAVELAKLWRLDKYLRRLDVCCQFLSRP